MSDITILPTIAPAPNAKQLADIERLVAEARDVYEIECPDWCDAYPWHTRFDEETRPGRGHAINTVYVDGDHVVAINMDVYGSGSLNVGVIDWVHSSEDEECDCTPCQNERNADEAL